VGRVVLFLHPRSMPWSALRSVWPGLPAPCGTIVDMNDDMRRADDAQRGIAPDEYVLGQESIFESSLVPSPLGRTGEYKPYNNAIVYFFSLLSVFEVLFWPIPFGLIAIAIAVYRIHRHRPNAVRGLVVAVVCTMIGLLPFVLG